MIIDAFIRILLAMPELGPSKKAIEQMLLELPVIDSSLLELESQLPTLYREHTKNRTSVLEEGLEKSEEDAKLKVLHDEHQAKEKSIKQKIEHLLEREYLEGCLSQPPELPIPYPTLKEFFKATSYIEGDFLLKYDHKDSFASVSIRNFHGTLNFRDKQRCPLDENDLMSHLKEINKFLEHWEQVVTESNHFLRMVRIAWKNEYKKMPASDEFLPITIYLLPRDKETLLKLKVKLKFLLKMNPGSLFIGMINSGVHFLLKQHSEKKLDPQGRLIEFKDDYYDKHKVIIDKLNDYEKHMKLLTDNTIGGGKEFLEKILNLLLIICQDKMSKYFKRIYLQLSLYNNTDYSSGYKDVVPEDALENANLQILRMLDDISRGKKLLKLEGNANTQEKKPLEAAQEVSKAHHIAEKEKELTSLVQKYTAYLGIYRTVVKKNSSIFQRLLTVTKQIPSLIPDIGEDLAKTTLTMSPAICRFLGIKPKSVGIFGGLFSQTEVDTNVQLNVMLERLSLKMNKIGEEIHSHRDRIVSHSMPSLRPSNSVDTNI